MNTMISWEVKSRTMGQLGTLLEDAMITAGWWNASDESFTAIVSLGQTLLASIDQQDAHWWEARKDRTSEEILTELAGKNN